MFLIYFSWNKIVDYINPIILSIIGLSGLITYVYINVKGTAFGTRLNEFSLKYTSNSLFIGRQRLWEGAVNKIEESDRILTGLGNNVQFELLNGYLHSLYVQLFLSGWYLQLDIICLYIFDYYFTY